jgi:hypothetical protein
MRMTFIKLAGAVAAAALVAAPAQSLADTQSTYSTIFTQTQPLPSAGTYPGSMRLTISSDGIVNGWYIPSPSANFIPIGGGEKDGKFWLNIGRSGDLLVQGTIAKNGALVGSAVERNASEFSDTEHGFPAAFDFVATPQ